MRQCKYFQEVSKARMKEIDEIRASGGMTELEKWWKALDEKEGNVMSWNDEDIAYLVQRRPHISYKAISAVLNRTPGACTRKYWQVRRTEKFDYYMNYKLKTLDFKILI